MAVKDKFKGQNTNPGRIIKQGESSAEMEKSLKEYRKKQIASKIQEDAVKARRQQQIAQYEKAFSKVYGNRAGKQKKNTSR